MIDICFSGPVSGLVFQVKEMIQSDKIIPLDLHFNYGCLNGDVIEEQAKRNTETLRYHYKTITERELTKIYKEELKEEKKVVKELQKLLSGEQEIRLWLSNNANDRCGLYWFCSLAKHCKNKISVVFCPGYECDRKTNKPVETRTWELFDNLHFVAKATETARLLTENEILAYAETWQILVDKHAPFRILVNDVIVGLEENFFDDAILKFISNKPKPQTQIMGEMLAKWNACCDCAFISKRIEHLLKDNKIKVCEEHVDEDDCYWRRTLSLT